MRCKQRFRRGRGTACEWTDKASEIFRKNPKWAKQKFLVMRKLTDMVMGDPNFLPNPCAILCPFDGARCTHGFFRMNGSCKTALLALAAHACQQPRRQAAGGALAPGDQDEGHISLEQLDQCAPCTLTGDTEEGYEPLRTPPGRSRPSSSRTRSRLAPPSSGSGSPGRAFEVSW